MLPSRPVPRPPPFTGHPLSSPAVIDETFLPNLSLHLSLPHSPSPSLSLFSGNYIHCDTFPRPLICNPRLISRDSLSPLSLRIRKTTLDADRLGTKKKKCAVDFFIGQAASFIRFRRRHIIHGGVGLALSVFGVMYLYRGRGGRRILQRLVLYGPFSLVLSARPCRVPVSSLARCAVLGGWFDLVDSVSTGHADDAWLFRWPLPEKCAERWAAARTWLFRMARLLRSRRKARANLVVAAGSLCR